MPLCYINLPAKHDNIIPSYLQSQLNRQHTQVHLRLIRIVTDGLTQCSSCLCVTHVTQAHGSYVNSTCLHTHSRHALPDGLTEIKDNGKQTTAVGEENGP